MSQLIDTPSVEGIENAEVSLMLRQLEQVPGEYIRMLGEVSEEELVWQPFEAGHSIAALLVHIAEVEAFWLHHVGCSEPYQDIEDEALGAEIDQGNVRWPVPPPGRPLSYYLELLSTTRARTKELLATCEGLDVVATREDGRSFTMLWLLTHVILHSSYHWGQAVLLLLQQRKAQG